MTMRRRDMKMKNLVAFAMLALGAVAAPFAAQAADFKTVDFRMRYTRYDVTYEMEK